MGTELQGEVYSGLCVIACVQYFCIFVVAGDVVFNCCDKFSPVSSPYWINNIEKAEGSFLKPGILHRVLTTVPVSLLQHSALQMAASAKKVSISS